MTTICFEMYRKNRLMELGYFNYDGDMEKLKRWIISETKKTVGDKYNHDRMMCVAERVVNSNETVLAVVHYSDYGNVYLQLTRWDSKLDDEKKKVIDNKWSEKHAKNGNTPLYFKDKNNININDTIIELLKTYL